VENSWGKEKGREGFYTMNDSWFDQFVFEIAAPRDRIPEKLRRELDTDPTVLPAWDPMGSLAR
jgi:bleomycin hydrolase